MKTKLVKIGNSYGIRLPKVVIDTCDLKSDLDLVVKGKSILITATKQPRMGWAQAIQDEVSSRPLGHIGEWQW